MIGLEVGYALIPLVDKSQGGALMQRIKGVRKKLSHELGFLVQSVHIRDNLDLSPNQYHININGVTRGQGELMMGRDLAINPGATHGSLEGIPTQIQLLDWMRCGLIPPKENMPSLWATQ